MRGRARARHDPRLHDQCHDRPQPEHHQRVAKQPIGQAAPPPARVVLGHGQGRKVADAATFQIPGSRVVHRMGVLPAIEGREHEQTQRGAQPSVRPFGGQERSVCAVVKDDVGADQKAGSWNRERDCEQVRDPQGESHEHEQRQVGHDRGEHTPQAAPAIRSGIRLERVPPERLPPAGGSLLSWPLYVLMTVHAGERTGALADARGRSSRLAPQRQHESSRHTIGAAQLRHRRGKRRPHTAERPGITRCGFTDMAPDVSRFAMTTGLAHAGQVARAGTALARRTVEAKLPQWYPSYNVSTLFLESAHAAAQ